MKALPKCMIGALCLSFFLAHAELQIDWWKIGGATGQSTGGVWAVSGTVGAGAGTASGGLFTLTSGYWSVIGTVPTPDAPRLIIERLGGNIRIAWPRSAEGFVLQETSTLTGSPVIPWGASPYTRETNATQISVTLPLPPGIRYFRLHHP